MNEGTNALNNLSHVTRYDERGPTACPSAAASAPPITVKKPTISRAERSAAWACSALWHPSFEYQEHVPTTPAQDHTCTTDLDLNHARLPSGCPERAFS